MSGKGSGGVQIEASRVKLGKGRRGEGNKKFKG